MVRFGVAEGIIKEDFDRFDTMCMDLKKLLLRDIDALSSQSTTRLLRNRYNRFRRIGIFEEPQEQ